MEKILFQGGDATILNSNHNEFYTERKAVKKWGFLIPNDKGLKNLYVENFQKFQNVVECIPYTLLYFTEAVKQRKTAIFYRKDEKIFVWTIIRRGFD